MNRGDLKPLVQYAQGAFPQARISLAVDFSKGSLLVPDEALTNARLPNWLPATVSPASSLTTETRDS